MACVLVFACVMEQCIQGENLQLLVSLTWAMFTPDHLPRCIARGEGTGRFWLAVTSVLAKWSSPLCLDLFLLRAPAQPLHLPRQNRAPNSTAAHHLLVAHLTAATNYYLQVGPSTRARTMAAPGPDLNAILAALGRRSTLSRIIVMTNCVNSCRARSLYHTIPNTAAGAVRTSSTAATASWLSGRNANSVPSRHPRLHLPSAHQLWQSRPQRDQARQLWVREHPRCTSQSARICSAKGSAKPACLRSPSRYRPLVWHDELTAGLLCTSA